MRFVHFLISLIALNMVSIKTDESAPVERSQEMVAKLRNKAVELGHSPLSNLFAAILRREAGIPTNLTTVQIELAGRLDLLGRDVIQAWLVRGLDKDPLPLEAELADRLGRRGDEVRQSTVAHLEAMALQMILTPAQAARWQKEAGQPSTVKLSGRYRTAPAPVPWPPQSPQQLFEMVRTEANKWEQGYASPYLMFLCGDVGGAWRGNSAEQKGLCRRLDVLTRDTARAWVMRGLEDRNPPIDDLADRLDDRGRRLRTSVIAHAESVAARAILTPDQLESYLKFYWKSAGVEALLDSELAHRLKLTHAQRTEISSRIEAELSFVNQAHANLIPDLDNNLVRQLHGEPGSTDQMNLLKREMQSLSNEGDAVIWSVLSPAQLKEAEQILGGSAKSPPRPSAKPKRSNVAS